METDHEITFDQLIGAYCQGYFPMAHPEEENQIYWHKPDMRGIIPLDDFHIPKNVSRLYNKRPYSLWFDRDFEQTIRSCAERDTTWISEDIIQLYVRLHELGFASSVEAWDQDELVGGLYGVVINKAFFGESMFFKRTDASKLCLVHLIKHLVHNDFILLDTQYINDHLRQFGAKEIPGDEYEILLQKAIVQTSQARSELEE